MSSPEFLAEIFPFTFAVEDCWKVNVLDILPWSSVSVTVTEAIDELSILFSEIKSVVFVVDVIVDVIVDVGCMDNVVAMVSFADMIVPTVLLSNEDERVVVFVEISVTYCNGYVWFETSEK